MKTTAPKRYTASDIKRWDIQTETESGQWIPARPYHLTPGLFGRLVLAWGVFVGKYDALWWEQ